MSPQDLQSSFAEAMTKLEVLPTAEETTRRRPIFVRGTSTNHHTEAMNAAAAALRALWKGKSPTRDK